MLHGRVAHEEKRVAERLCTGLQTGGEGTGAIVASGLAVFQQCALASLRADDEACLDDAREDEHALGFFTERPCGRSVGIKRLQRRGDVLVQCAGRRGVCGDHPEHLRDDRSKDGQIRQRA